MKKIIIAGGSGCIGSALARYYKNKVTEIIILSRESRPQQGNIRTISWDGKTTGPWINELNGADMLINLTGRNVNCRYNKKNRDEILNSRIDSTKVLGEAIRSVKHPPRLWIQSSSATIYRHAEDRPMDEFTGEIGEGFSVEVCKAWEKTFQQQATPCTRKVLLRIGIVMTNFGGAFPNLLRLVKAGMGGRQATGNQYISWIHIDDLVNIIDWIFHREYIQGTYNCTSPKPIQNSFMMKNLRKQCHAFIGLTMPRWLLEAGAAVIGTETELILKSRWVLPAKLLKEGYPFRYCEIEHALANLLDQKST